MDTLSLKKLQTRMLTDIMLAIEKHQDFFFALVQGQLKDNMYVVSGNGVTHFYESITEKGVQTKKEVKNEFTELVNEMVWSDDGYFLNRKYINVQIDLPYKFTNKRILTNDVILKIRNKYGKDTPAHHVKYLFTGDI
jgi:hypothetical protein